MTSKSAKTAKTAAQAPEASEILRAALTANGIPQATFTEAPAETLREENARLRAELAAAKEAAGRAARRSEGDFMLDVISSAERASLIALSLHERLIAAGDTSNAREVWVLFLESSRSAERMGDALGVEVTVG